MKFKLYKDVIPEYSAKQQVLYNRGIPVKEQEAWLNAGWESINDWRLLDEEKMRKAVELVDKMMKHDGKIAVVVD